ncbi:MAG: LysR family transcriptional regulator [Bacteriovoracaceae bacterium]|nr:LysR family transcriptional regulator [Bacteriovoracaceae bacterium]
MEYRYLKAFILTAQYASFSKAAEVLEIAQSAVSRQIKLLEENLSEELIIRSSKKVLLTSKGRELYIAASNFDKTALNIFEQEDMRPLRIGLLHGLLESWFHPILSTYYKNFNRNMEVTVMTPLNLKAGLGEGQFDIIFTTENIQSELITSLKLFDERIILISRDEIDQERLADYRWIVYSDQDNMYKTTKVSSKSIVQVDSITTIVNLVKSGVGIATVPAHTIKRSDKLFTYELPQFDDSLIYMSTLNYKTMPKHIKEIAQLVRAD